MHHIQKYILKELTLNKVRRYSEMRPQRIDSNLYSYHLKSLMRDQFVAKRDKLYYLMPRGLAYVERISIDNFEPRMQPKILMVFVIENERDEVLLWQKRKQPFVETWSLLSGKMHLEDDSLSSAINRESFEKFGSLPRHAQHVGDCYIRAYIENELVSYVGAHIVKLQVSDEAHLHPRTCWVRKSELFSLDTAPATERIIHQVQTEQPFFFEEYNIYGNME